MNFFTDHQQYLLIGKITGSLSAEEEEGFEKFLQEYPEARQAYEQLVGKFPAEDVATSFARFKDPGKWKDIVTPFRQGSSTKRRSMTRRWMAAAAVFIILCTGGWLIWSKQQAVPVVQTADPLITSPSHNKNIILTLADGKTIDLSSAKGNIAIKDAQLNNDNNTLRYSKADASSVSVNTLIVPVGMDYKVSLSDGSLIWLNAATKLKFPFSFVSNTREITIDGEAYLQIAKNTAKPFIVHLPNSTVKVTGTEFNVNTYDQSIVKVSLVEGAVRFQANQQEIALSPDKEAVLRNGTQLSESIFDSRITLSWREGLFYFNKASIQEISQVLPRWFGIEVRIDNPSLASRKFTGVIDKKQPIIVFQDDLRAISNIDTYIDENKVLHFR